MSSSSTAIPALEKGHKIPDRYEWGRWKRLCSRIKVGESFTVKEEYERSSAMSRSKRYGIKLTSRKINGGGFRLWRIK